MRIVGEAKAICPKRDVSLAVGGMHHPPLSVVEGLRGLGVKKVAPSHCTGDRVIAEFRGKYGEDFVAYGVGKVIEIE
jgi:7,8-dihydropterin-6-yl-methyl-4-(beta-D-ribofuranosyl)aminobenzene 5'-phosphate synthase